MVMGANREIALKLKYIAVFGDLDKFSLYILRIIFSSLNA